MPDVLSDPRLPTAAQQALAGLDELPVSEHAARFRAAYEALAAQLHDGPRPGQGA